MNDIGYLRKNKQVDILEQNLNERKAAYKARGCAVLDARSRVSKNRITSGNINIFNIRKR